MSHQPRPHVSTIAILVIPEASLPRCTPVWIGLCFLQAKHVLRWLRVLSQRLVIRSPFCACFYFLQGAKLLSSLERAKNIGRFGRLERRTVRSVHS